jgi:hypothetical protein
MKIVRWVAVAGAVVGLVSVGVFFAMQSRGAADQYASVGAFFLALLTAATSLVTWIRSPRGDAGPAGPDRQGSTITVNGPVSVLQTGPRSKAKVRNTYKSSGGGSAS